MNIEFNESNMWYASETESDNVASKRKGPYQTKEDAIKQYASKLVKTDALIPFYVHTSVDVVFTPDANKFIDWIIDNAVSNGVYALDNFQKLKDNPKSMEVLNKDLTDAITKAFASVQQTNKVTLKESYRVYPREYIKHMK